jgi:hypothetical protein
MSASQVEIPKVYVKGIDEPFIEADKIAKRVAMAISGLSLVETWRALQSGSDGISGTNFTSLRGTVVPGRPLALIGRAPPNDLFYALIEACDGETDERGNEAYAKWLWDGGAIVRIITPRALFERLLALYQAGRIHRFSLSVVFDTALRKEPNLVPLYFAPPEKGGPWFVEARIEELQGIEAPPDENVQRISKETAIQLAAKIRQQMTDKWCTDEFVKNKVHRFFAVPDGYYGDYGELISLFTKGVIEYSVSHGDGHDGFCERYQDALYLAWDLYSALYPDGLTVRCNDGKWQLSEARHWVHRDPVQALERGTEYKGAVVRNPVDAFRVSNAAARYLPRRWLHCDKVEWWIVDALTFNTIMYAGLKADTLFPVYGRPGRWLKWARYPILVILFSVLQEWFHIPTLLTMSLIICLIGFYTLGRLWMTKPVNEMIRAYNALSAEEAPLSPTRVREKLAAAEATGLVEWPHQIVWPLLDLAITRNRAVWALSDDDKYYTNKYYTNY